MPKAEDRIGPYTLIRKLGQGSFGVVWLAERRGKFLTTQVALKIPMDDEPDLLAIQREAQSWLTATGHPNVLPVLDADEYDGQIVIVSEYAPDGTLSDWLKRYGGKAPSTDAAVSMTCGILSGLQHLHNRKMIHRDLKPGNVLLQGDTPRLTDFGVSRVLRTMGATNVAGTPAYMAPEMFDGLFSEQTDIWAVGVMLYRMLAGELPFHQQGWGALYAAIKEDEPTALPDEVPPHVRAVVTRALVKNPDQRFTAASEMRLALLSTSVPTTAGAPERPTFDYDTARREAAPAVPEPARMPEFDLGFDAVRHSNAPPPAAPRANASERSAARPEMPPAPPAPPTPGRTAEPSPRAFHFSFLKRSESVRGNTIDGAEMVWVPAGEFTMGDPEQIDNPRRRTSVEGFWIYRCPVTVEKYRRFCTATAQSMPEAPPWGWIDSHPVVNVHWQNAIDYCKWARVALPTEVQWEKAARGVDARRFPWSGPWDSARCRCSKSNQGDAGSTAAVGSYPSGASAYGVVDMAGNVWEWCHEMIDGASLNSEPGSGPRRVLRGGSWECNMSSDFRTAFRQRQFPSYMYFTIGFRCVKNGDPP